MKIFFLFLYLFLSCLPNRKRRNVMEMKLPKMAMRTPRPSKWGWDSMKRSAAISFLGMREAKKVDSFSLKLLNRPLSSPLDSPNEEPGIALTILLVLILVLLLHSLLVLLGLGFVLIKLMLGPLVLLIPMMRNGGGGVSLGSLINNGFCIFFFFFKWEGVFW